MTITKPGKYRLTERWSIHDGGTITHYPVGSILTITQVDDQWNKITGPNLPGWAHRDVPCVPVEDKP